jgi:hypothetical protein
MLENPNLNLSKLYNSWAKIACCSSQLIFRLLYAGSSIQNASEQFVWCVHLSFVNFALYPNPEKNLTSDSKRLYLGNHSELDTCSYELFFSKWWILSSPKILTFPPESPVLSNL